MEDELGVEYFQQHFEPYSGWEGAARGVALRRRRL